MRMRMRVVGVWVCVGAGRGRGYQKGERKDELARTHSQWHARTGIRMYTPVTLTLTMVCLWKLTSVGKGADTKAGRVAMYVKRTREERSGINDGRLR